MTNQSSKTKPAPKAVSLTAQEKDLAIQEVTKLRDEAEETRMRCVPGAAARVQYERITFALNKALEILEATVAAD